MRILAVLGVTLTLSPEVFGAGGENVYRTRSTGGTGDNDVTAAVDYMLSTLKLSIPETGKETLTTQTAHTRVLPRAQIEGARVGGITVEARDGRIALRGMVDSTQVIRAAEDIARGVPGVVAVENRLIAADLFEHD